MEKQQFDDLVENTQYVLVATIYKITLNWESARDIAQDAFLRIWERREKLHMDKKPEPLLFKIAINQAIDFTRSQRYKKNTSMEIIDTAAIPAEKESDDQNAGLLNQILKFAVRLKSKQQCCFILRDIEGYAIADIAEVLNSNQQAVRTNLHHARKKIREYITQYFPEYLEELP